MRLKRGLIKMVSRVVVCLGATGFLAIPASADPSTPREEERVVIGNHALRATSALIAGPPSADSVGFRFTSFERTPVDGLIICLHLYKDQPEALENAALLFELMDPHDRVLLSALHTPQNQKRNTSFAHIRFPGMATLDPGKVYRVRVSSPGRDPIRFGLFAGGGPLIDRTPYAGRPDASLAMLRWLDGRVEVVEKTPFFILTHRGVGVQGVGQPLAQRVPALAMSESEAHLKRRFAQVFRVQDGEVPAGKALLADRIMLPLRVTHQPRGSLIVQLWDAALLTSPEAKPLASAELTPQQADLAAASYELALHPQVRIESGKAYALTIAWALEADPSLEPGDVNAVEGRAMLVVTLPPSGVPQGALSGYGGLDRAYLLQTTGDWADHVLSGDGSWDLAFGITGVAVDAD